MSAKTFPLSAGTYGNVHVDVPNNRWVNVWLHNHLVASIDRDNNLAVITDAGYPTPTTCRAINHALDQAGFTGRVAIRQGVTTYFPFPNDDEYYFCKLGRESLTVEKKGRWLHRYH